MVQPGGVNDSITGGVMPTGGAVKLTIDADKKGWVQLPNGVYLETVAGVINATYTGATGGITYYVPKVGGGLSISNSSITGELTYNGSVNFNASVNTLITSISCQNSNDLYMAANTGMTELIDGSATIIIASGCALTAKSIGDILYAAYNDARADVNYNFSGGTNANASAVYSYLTSQYGLVDPESQIIDYLLDNGGTIQLNP